MPGRALAIWFVLLVVAILNGAFREAREKLPADDETLRAGCGSWCR